MKKFFLFCAATLLTVISANADVTVKVKNVPWEACYGYTWGGLSQNGTFAMTKEGDYFTYTFTDVTGDIEMLIKNTESDWDQQSNDFPKFSADACFSVSGTGKLNVTTIDCATGDLPTVDAYYIKNNWNSGEWTWQEMTPNEDKSEWTYTGVYGGNGVNIGVQVDDPNALWFVQDKIQGTATVGAEVTFTYNVAAGTVTAVSGDTPTPPAPGTSTYYLVGYINGVDYGISGDIDNMGDYNLTTGPVVITFTEKSYVQVKNQNKSIYGTAYVDATEPGSTVLSVGATDKIGLPANVEITFTLTENADGTVTLAYAWGDTPTPPTPAGDQYYIKNNWNGGGDDSWAWMEMTPNEDKSEWTYTGVYGGSGVNINTKADDAGSQWFPQDQIQGTATVGAEVTFTYNVAAGTVTAVSGDTPTPPTPSENVYGITVNGTPVLGTKNESPLDPSFEEWQVLEQSLVTGDLVTLYNQNGGATWVVALDEASVEGIELNATGDAYIITQDGCYNFYIKLKFEADQLYVGSCGDTPTPPTPGEEGFGIILGDGSTVKGWKNEGQTEWLEYMIEADLTTGATFQLYDFGNQAAWTEQNIDEASTPNVTINASGVYEVLADGHYTIYLKMYGPENNQVYIGYTEPTSIREATIKAAVKKMVVDGIFYIVKDNKAYTAHGF